MERTSDKKWVYIASPYTKGDMSLNVRFQMYVWNILLDLGVVPIAPLWGHFQHVSIPRTYREWLDYDFELIKRCDVVVRLDAVDASNGEHYRQHESPGADEEVRLALSLGKPVCYSLFELAVLLGKGDDQEGRQWCERL